MKVDGAKGWRHGAIGIQKHKPNMEVGEVETNRGKIREQSKKD